MIFIQHDFQKMSSVSMSIGKSCWSGIGMNF